MIFLRIVVLRNVLLLMLWVVLDGRLSRFARALSDPIVKNPTHVHSSTFCIAETSDFCAAVALAASTTGESKRHPYFLSIQKHQSASFMDLFCCFSATVRINQPSISSRTVLAADCRLQVASCRLRTLSLSPRIGRQMADVGSVCDSSFERNRVDQIFMWS